MVSGVIYVQEPGAKGQVRLATCQQIQFNLNEFSTTSALVKTVFKHLEADDGVKLSVGGKSQHINEQRFGERFGLRIIAPNGRPSTEVMTLRSNEDSFRKALVTNLKAAFDRQLNSEQGDKKKLSARATTAITTLLTPRVMVTELPTSKQNHFAVASSSRGDMKSTGRRSQTLSQTGGSVVNDDAASDLDDLMSGSDCESEDLPVYRDDDSSSNTGWAQDKCCQGRPTTLRTVWCAFALCTSQGRRCALSLTSCTGN